MAYFIGQGGSISVGTGTPVTVCVETWSVSYTNDAQDVTTTCSAFWQDVIAGVNSAELTFSGYYDAAASIFTTVEVGDTLAFTAPLGTGGEAISGNFLVTGLNVENPAKTTVKFTVTAKSTGPIVAG